MARVIGPLQLSGTIGDLTFYVMKGKCYARQKTSLNKKRFYSDPCYSGLPMMRVKNFGRASQLASAIYRKLPKILKCKTLYNQMTALAHDLLWQNYAPEAVTEALMAHFDLQAEGKTPPQQKQVEPTVTASEIAEKKVSPKQLLREHQKPKSRPRVERASIPQEKGNRGVSGLSLWRVTKDGNLYRPDTWLPLTPGSQERSNMQNGTFSGWNMAGYHPN